MLTRARVLVTAFAILSSALSVPALAQVQFTSDAVRIALDAKGQVTSLLDVAHQRECLEAGQPAALLSVRIGGETTAPDAMTADAKSGVLTLRYGTTGVRARVKGVAKPGYVSFELVGLEPVGRVDAVLWGPYPTVIGQTVGEIVGVVRDDKTALSLQVLNLKTRGGALLNDEGSDPSRGTLAQAAPYGSVLQAFALDRSRPRTVAGWNGQYVDMPVPPMPGETPVGTKIALFASSPDQALTRIGEIEVQEHLPHPLVDGVWAKQWREQGRSYLIAPFSETTAPELLESTRRAGLMTLYHPEPFKSWGHYELDPKAFPTGNAGMSRIVSRATAMGIRIGVHTLTNFINTDDPYVSPVPDPRLARTGSSPLTAPIDPTTAQIEVASPAPFANEKANWLHTVVIDRELVRYRAVSTSAPWKLLDCERGAFGTKPAPHAAGASVGKLVDHPYKVFYPTLDLQDEIARNLARFFNQTGVSQLDFDGREGCLASGQGDYAEDRFALVFYENLDHPVVNGTSTSSPFYWHINSYCNWGEPWYGGFRESMQEYRIANQALFSRNFVPNMLGWYKLTATTSLAEMEWMLARAAGFGAGFAMSTTVEELRANADAPMLLDAIREWETARRSGAFSNDQRARLRDSTLEFHLETVTPASAWRLFPYHDTPALRYERADRQPGEPADVAFTFANPDEEQPLQFRVLVPDGGATLARLRLDLDASRTLELPLGLAGGESAVFDGVGPIRLYDVKGRQRGTLPAPTAVPRVARGTHRLVMDGSFSGAGRPVVEVTVRTRGPAEDVTRR